MTAPPAPIAPTAAGPPVGRIIAVVLGALGLLVGLAASAVGAGLVWVDQTQLDADGFLTSDTERFDTASYAITTEDIDLGTDPGDRDRGPDLGDLATIRLAVESASADAVFVGIGPTDEVESYLAGVERVRIDDVDVDPFRVDYDPVDGGAPSGEPGAEDFWVVSADGPGRQSFEWELESGDWTVVVMNSDGGSAVAVDATVGAKSDWLLPVGLIALGFGLASLFGGAALLVLGAIGLARRLEHEPAPGPASAGPVRLTGRLDEPGRWLWLVKWILVIPHVIVLIALWLAAAVVGIVAFFAILFTGRYPRSLFDFVVGVLRWTWRVGFYSFSALATDAYPPFTLGPAPDYPATLDVAYPEHLSRGLVLVKWWLLAIPHYLVLGVIGGGIGWAATEDGGAWTGGGLLSLLVAFAAIALLFTKRYPDGLFDLVMGLNRWVFRVVAYSALLTDDYPPFRLDQGPDEPPAAVAGGAVTSQSPVL